MKLIFFLIAFCLLSIRFYFSWSGKDRERRGVSESNMVIKSDNFYEEIKYSGIFKLSDDESSFTSISPGGYFKFRMNDIRVKAESNLRAEIDYTINDGNHDLPMNGDAKKYLAQAIKEMIAWGYDAEGRMERIYRKGGSAALFREIDSIKPDNIKVMYLQRLLRSDPGLASNIPLIMKKIGKLDNDQDKMAIIGKFSAAQLQDSATITACFEVIAGLNADYEKAHALENIIMVDTTSATNAEKILALSGTLPSDMDKANLYRKMIEKGMITGPRFDSLIIHISSMGSDMDKSSLYREISDTYNLTEMHWIVLISQVPLLGSDMDKANLLSAYASKMPKTEAVKTAFRKAAKTINNDMDYGKAVRAIE
jgi:hypothetical protein